MRGNEVGARPVAAATCGRPWY